MYWNTFGIPTGLKQLSNPLEADFYFDIEPNSGIVFANYQAYSSHMLLLKPRQSELSPNFTNAFGYINEIPCVALFYTTLMNGRAPNNVIKSFRNQLKNYDLYQQSVLYRYIQLTLINFNLI